jgi:ribosomal protein L37E
MDGQTLAVVLSRAQREWLRAMIDRLARERLAYEDSPRCKGCGVLAFERTSGCAHCRFRHAARRRQLRQMFAEGRLPSGRSRSARARWRSPA